MITRSQSRSPRRDPQVGDRARRPRTGLWLEVRSTIGTLMYCHNLQENRPEMLTLLDWDRLEDHQTYDEFQKLRGNL